MCVIGFLASLVDHVNLTGSVSVHQLLSNFKFTIFLFTFIGFSRQPQQQIVVKYKKNTFYLFKVKIKTVNFIAIKMKIFEEENTIFEVFYGSFQLS